MLQPPYNQTLNLSKHVNIMNATRSINNAQHQSDLMCPVCTAKANLWVQLPAVSLFRCIDCGHCFTDVSSIAVEENYGSDYYKKTHRNWFENPNYPLFTMLETEISQHKVASVLDVGCGNGDFIKFIAKNLNQLDLHGIDLSDEAKSANGIEFIQGNFLNYEFHKKFDVVVTLAVIEHLDNVSSFVARIHELLNTNGIACVMTFNESGLLYKFANLLRKLGFPSVFVRLYDPHHLNHFSKHSLERLLTKDGLFAVKKVIDHNTPLAAIDVPAANPLMRWLMKIGVSVVFFAGKLTGNAYLQTIVVAKVG